MERKRRIIAVDSDKTLRVIDHTTGDCYEGTQEALLQVVAPKMCGDIVNFTVNDNEGFGAYAKLKKEIAVLSVERDDLLLALRVYSGRKDMFGLSKAEKDTITRALALADQDA